MPFDLDLVFMVAGFCLAAYSVVGNDVMQTLGTFLSSNSTRPWYVLWIFAGSILTAVVVYSWVVNNGDPAYGRLVANDIDLPKPFGWFYVLPPIILLLLTRLGFPVSTTFLILSLFGSKVIGDMIVKSLLGYVIAFVAAIVAYYFIAEKIEKKFIETDLKKNHTKWVVFQWLSTGFLWSQWLIQDLANIFVYMPRQLKPETLVFTLIVLLGLLGYIFYSRGGAIQRIVTVKTNTNDIRSATIIDLLFGIIMYLFKEGYVMYLVGKEPSKLPMSTTWIFIGLLAGREIGLRYKLYRKNIRPVMDDMGRDVGKAAAGLVVSVLLVVLIKWLAGEPIPFSQ